MTVNCVATSLLQNKRECKMCSYVYLEDSFLTTARSGSSTVRGLLIYVNVLYLVGCDFH